MKKGRILIVDDDATAVALLERILKGARYSEVRSTTDPREALMLFKEFEPDLVLLDLHMALLDGFSVLKQLRTLIPEEIYLPILIVTGDHSPEAKRRVLAEGAKDILTKPFDPVEVVLRIANLLETRRLHGKLHEYNEALEQKVNERTTELRTALTRLEAAQNQIVQQERMRALGMMASGVVHDFNNTLGVILGYGELVLNDCERLPDAGEISDNVRTLILAAEDAARMVERLKEFHRPADADEMRWAVDLNILVEQAVSLTQPKWKSQALERGCTIAVKADLQEISALRGNPVELREILTNLIFNAVDAMSAGGAITIRTRPEPDGVRLEVADTGAGMDEEVQQRCLEPFFSTKGKAGTGLGLSIVYGIVQRHRGDMKIESEPGKGATIIIRFPLEAIVSDEPEPIAPPLTAALRILLVDDHPLLSEVLARFLRDDDHMVECAADGQQALEWCRRQPFDLVITDHAMPGMSGAHLASAIKSLDPRVPVILVTGSGNSTGLQEKHVGDIDLILEKPVSRAALRNALAQVMTATSHAEADETSTPEAPLHHAAHSASREWCSGIGR